MMIRRHFLALPLLMPLLGCTPAGSARQAGPWRGVNLTRTPEAPLGSEACGRSLAGLKALGADAVALVCFFWQEKPESADITLGNDIPLAELRAGIRQARGMGLKVLLKPHVWVPQTWAGAVAPGGDGAFERWFSGYGAGLEQLAELAADEGAEGLAIGTELRGTSHRPEWRDLIGRIRQRYQGLLTYVAHWDGEVMRVPFWDLLDVAAVSLYPPLGEDMAGVTAAIDRAAEQLVQWRDRIGKPLWIAELGLRSANGAQAKPWESAEERQALPDENVQSTVIEWWLTALTQCGFQDVLIWRWFSNPDIGGPQDTDFTIQGKRAAAVLHGWLTTHRDQTGGGQSRP
jgi:hypothetical protein